jgi:hypothetical protein
VLVDREHHGGGRAQLGARLVYESARKRIGALRFCGYGKQPGYGANGASWAAAGRRLIG